MEAAPQTYEQEDHEIKTYRYLRVAMLVIVFGLFASLFVELLKVDFECVQTSISAYYWTPVHSYFVGALVSLGVCLFCLKGNTEREDVLLNLAGMLAPVVAFVPIPNATRCNSAAERMVQDSAAGIANNVWTLIVVGAAGLAFLGVLALAQLPERPKKSELWGAAIAAGVLAIWGGAFVIDRGFFVDHAHLWSAGLMFFFIFLAVVNNAISFKKETRAATVRNRYGLIALLMLVSSAIIGAAAWDGWDHWIIAIELDLIVLFVAFWAIQTQELWRRGLRGQELPAGTGT